MPTPAPAPEPPLSTAMGTPYNGNPIEPSPKLLGQIADAANGGERTEAVTAWAKAYREQFPHA